MIRQTVVRVHRTGRARMAEKEDAKTRGARAREATSSTAGRALGADRRTAPLENEAADDLTDAHVQQHAALVRDSDPARPPVVLRSVRLARQLQKICGNGYVQRVVEQARDVGAATTGRGSHPVQRMPDPGVEYEVQRGDNLSLIADRFKVAGGWRAIYRHNRDRIDDPNIIHPGQRLVIPASTAEESDGHGDARARAAFERGRTAFASGRYEAAIDHFRTAMNTPGIRPDRLPGLVHNIAIAQAHTGDISAAMTTAADYREYHRMHAREHDPTPAELIQRIKQIRNAEEGQPDGPLTEAEVAEAKRYYRRRHGRYPADIVGKIQREVGSRVDGVIGPSTIQSVAGWQAANRLSVDGMAGPDTLSALFGSDIRPRPADARQEREGSEEEGATEERLRLVTKEDGWLVFNRLAFRDEVVDYIWGDEFSPSPNDLHARDAEIETSGGISLVTGDTHWALAKTSFASSPDLYAKMRPDVRARIRAMSSERPAGEDIGRGRDLVSEDFLIRKFVTGGVTVFAGWELAAFEIFDLTNHRTALFIYAGITGGTSVKGFPDASLGGRGDWKPITTSVPIRLEEFEGRAYHGSVGFQVGMGPSRSWLHLHGPVVAGADEVRIAWSDWWSAGLGAGISGSEGKVVIKGGGAHEMGPGYAP